MPDANTAPDNLWPVAFDFDPVDSVMDLLRANEEPLRELTQDLLVGEAQLVNLDASQADVLGFHIRAVNAFLPEKHTLFSATRARGTLFPLTLKTHPMLADQTQSETILVDDLAGLRATFRALLASPITAERVRYLMGRALGTAPISLSETS